mmetsp:Transcript_19378/g.16594  ORF Transcript_19378/g.16594 Transcript_19378/m.16594 type:complete len:88 (-) Transcript_19378:1178-1441(-)
MVEELEELLVGTKVWVRARLHNSRKQGSKFCFVVLREQMSTVQVVIQVSEGKVSPTMVKWAAQVPKESVIEVYGSVTKPEIEIKGCT